MTGYYKYVDKKGTSFIWYSGNCVPVNIPEGSAIYWATSLDGLDQVDIRVFNYQTHYVIDGVLCQILALPELVEQSEQRFEATEERLDPLPQIPHGEVRIVLDLEGALLELPAPEGASATQAWLTVEERAEEGAAISRHRVWITSFPDGSFHVDRILE